MTDTAKNQTYRQRLTAIGYIGATGAVLGPLLLAYGAQNYVTTSMEYAANPLITWSPPMPIDMIGGYLAATIGWILVIVGRERYAT